MACGIITGKTNIPSKLISYVGINTDTADITIDNVNYTFQVDVKKVPNDLVFITNDLEYTEIEYNGSEAVGIDLTPITLNPEGFEEYTSADIKKIFRKPTAGNYMEAPYVVSKEEKEIIDADVNISVSNNSPVDASKFFSCFDGNLDAFVNRVEVSNLFGNKYETTEEPEEEGDEPATTVWLNALRLGSNNNLGSITLYLNWSVNRLSITAGRYFSDHGGEPGTADATAQLFINGVEVELDDTLETQEVVLPSATSTLVIENRRSSGSKGGRVFLTNISTLDGGMVFAEKELAYKDYVEQNFVSNGNGRAYTLELFAADDDPLTYSQFDLYNASLLEVIDRQEREYRLGIELPSESQETDIRWNLPFKSGTIALKQDLIKFDDAEFEYDSENDITHIVFPAGSVPAKMKLCNQEIGEQVFYFDYPNEVLLDETGEVWEGSELYSDDNSSPIACQIPGNAIPDTNFGSSAILYFPLVCNVEEGSLTYPLGNTYNMIYAQGGGGSSYYRHRISIDAWDDTEPQGTNYDDITFFIISSKSSAFSNLAAFKQALKLGTITLEGATVISYLNGAEDTYYHGGMIVECYLNSINQNIAMTIDINGGEFTPKINASWTGFDDEVSPL